MALYSAVENAEPFGTVFDGFVGAWIVLAVIVFFVLLWTRAPYGRHRRAGWGPELSARLGWIVMETPSLLLMLGMFLSAGKFNNAALWVFATLWSIHYVHRSWIWPFRARIGHRTMPWSVVAMAFAFNLINAWINGEWIFHRSGAYGADWLRSPVFVVGVGLFLFGMALNIVSDTALMRLRAGGQRDYSIPRGGAFRWVSCPNYLGEILEWTGWAVATWCLPGAAFAIWTFANLAPRALAHHRWYRENHPDYPARRKALIPGLI